QHGGRRRGRGGRGRGRGWGGRRLLGRVPSLLLGFEIGEALVLLRLRLRLLLLSPGVPPAHRVRAAANRGRAQQRTSPPHHGCLLRLTLGSLEPVGQLEPES